MARYLGEDADGAMYESHIVAVKHNLDALHWDGQGRRYCDATVDNEAYKLVCHEGYVLLFPLLLGLLDANHANLPAVLELIADPERLWSPFGLRSLSKMDKNYGMDEDYWRGAEWINLNVVAVLRLRDVGLQDSGAEPTRLQLRALDLAAQLRERLVSTVFESWEETGFFWEQYEDRTGKGRRSRAFTGWTACILLLLGLRFEKSPARGDDAGDRKASSGIAGTLGVVVGLVLCWVVRAALRKWWMVAGGRVVQLWEKCWEGFKRRTYQQVVNLDEE